MSALDDYTPAVLVRARIQPGLGDVQQNLLAKLANAFTRLCIHCTTRCINCTTRLASLFLSPWMPFHSARFKRSRFRIT